MGHSNTADQEFIAAAMPAFISEADEQIEAIESLLLELEQQPDNRELLDSLFRCAHTVKGSAGIFGLTRVVEFTHHVETLLDKMRDGQLALSPDINTLLLQCNDQIRFLVDTAADEAGDTQEQRDIRADLVIQLRALADASSFQPATATQEGSTGTTGTSPRVWKIAARFGVDTFRNGMDPLSIARYLGGLGRVVSMHCVSDAVPALAKLDPENCFLSFTMELETSCGREEIEGAFSFVLEDCELDVVEPETENQKMTRAIEAIPETPRLGDMLVQVGAVSLHKLEQVLTTRKPVLLPRWLRRRWVSSRKSATTSRARSVISVFRRIGSMPSSICWGSWSSPGLEPHCWHATAAMLP